MTLKAIAVTGATGHLGHLGSLIIEKLTAAPGVKVVALARSLDKAAELGVESHAFDYRAPEAFAEALKGVDALMLTPCAQRLFAKGNPTAFFQRAQPIHADLAGSLSVAR